ncbi:formate dehydrogenase-N subunit alpha [Rodentibacter caecimuris]|uniref:Formate dehydrogenase-N subunit alpha n=3 Tax=Rodentibacter caecimuris TaxID=1796644 RepID=A0ABX3KXE5_9PAST|nr:formate dehydrogenase-N subunit alpha [Rodentibacter heylii]
MTNHWVDIKNADLVIVMGGNAAEAHPVGFRWAIEAKKQNGAKLMVVDPRFNRTASVADIYMPIRSGTDIAFLSGVIRYLLGNDKIQHEYVRHYTNATFLVNEGFNFEDGLFSGYDEAKRQYDKSTWSYQLDEQGQPRRDMSMQDPRCVINMLKAHVERYTPEMVERICGTKQKDFQLFCEEIAKTSAPDKAASFLYALGWTQHSIGSQNIRTMAMIQLLLGNIGVSGGGVNALRGHSNVQGITDLGLFPNMLPGYLPLPTENDTSLAAFLERITPKTMADGQINYWQNTPKFVVSLLKAFYGDKATKDNEFGYHFLPKQEKIRLDHMRFIDRMYEGKVNGYMCQGFNPIASYPNTGKIIKALSKLKFLVIFDPLVTDTSEFWKNFGEYNDVKSEDIQTEVFRLPTTCFVEEDGSIANSGRWLQWHWKGADQPGEAKPDVDILSEIREELLHLYHQDKESAKGLESFEAMAWNYTNPLEPKSDELAKENNGYALADLLDANGNVVVKKGELLSSFAQLRDDGTTSSACWIYTGQWTPRGNQMANRDNSDPSGLGNTLGWAFAWPLNRRIIYNRASADLAGNPWNPKRQLVKWNGKNWNYVDVADYGTAPPNSKVMPFIMQAEGVSRLFALDKMAEGPFPEHYEPIESPIGTNPLHPNVVSNPVARILDNDRVQMGTAKDFPYVGTTYRLTEHFHFWTKNALLNVIAQPEQFVEISEQLAAEKGISNGDHVKVTSKRGYIKAVAVVTKRVRSLEVNGQMVHTVGIPIHWGFSGVGKKGFFANNLTPRVGDGNTQTPEFKTFLVNIEKTEAI